MLNREMLAHQVPVDDERVSSAGEQHEVLEQTNVIVGLVRDRAVCVIGREIRSQRVDDVIVVRHVRARTVGALLAGRERTAGGDVVGRTASSTTSGHVRLARDGRVHVEEATGLTAVVAATDGVIAADIHSDDVLIRTRVPAVVSATLGRVREAHRVGHGDEGPQVATTSTRIEHEHASHSLAVVPRVLPHIRKNGHGAPTMEVTVTAAILREDEVGVWFHLESRRVAHGRLPPEILDQRTRRQLPVRNDLGVLVRLSDRPTRDLRHLRKPEAGWPGK